MEILEKYFYTEGLSVGHTSVPLIKDICLSLERGEILTLIGPNGAGKTTILSSLARQLKPLGGTVYIGEMDAFSLTGNEFAKKVSAMFTSRASTEMMTCEDVVSAGRYPYTGKLGLLSESDYEKVREAMELVNVSDIAKRDYTHTSDGQKQRVLLARALCQEPELLILDEPTSFLDIRYKLEFLSLIRKLAIEKHMAVIMSLHELEMAQRISDKVACVKGDKILRFGAPEEIFVPGFIESLYDISIGSYDCASGITELNAPQGEPGVFVICGNGKGTPVFRLLQRRNIPFSAGIVWENDTDFSPASALGREIISVPAFAEITDELIDKAKTEIAKAGKVVCAIPKDEMTGHAHRLKELADFAKDKIVSINEV